MEDTDPNGVPEMTEADWQRVRELIEEYEREHQPLV